MTLIARYLIKQLSITTLYAMFALLALYSFFDIVAEVGGVGEGGYTGIKMMQYVLLQIPDHAYQMMPLAVLIGGLIALNRLAANSEMTVIKTSGMSTKNIIAILLGFGLIFAAATALLGESVAPAANRYAQNLKTTAKNGKISTGAQGLWIKEQNNIIKACAASKSSATTKTSNWPKAGRQNPPSSRQTEAGNWQTSAAASWTATASVPKNTTANTGRQAYAAACSTYCWSIPTKCRSPR